MRPFLNFKSTQIYIYIYIYIYRLLVSDNPHIYLHTFVMYFHVRGDSHLTFQFSSVSASLLLDEA